MSANRAAEKFRPISELRDELSELGVGLEAMTDWQIYRDAPVSRWEGHRFRHSLNGQLGRDSFTERGKVAVIDAFDFEGGVGRLKRAETVVAVDIPNARAVIRHRDRERFSVLHRRFQKDMGELRSRDAELRKSYGEALPEMTSVEFWRGYLGL